MAYFGHAGGRLFIICIINNDRDRRPLTVTETVPSKGEGIPAKVLHDERVDRTPHPKPRQDVLSGK